MLVRSIRERRCVLFAGAGLSAQATTADGSHMPTWGALLDRMIDWCIDNRVQLRAKPEEFREVIERGRLQVVAQELQQSLGGQLHTCLSSVLHSGNAKPSEAHRLASKIGWVAALTSNYDGLIEGAHALESDGIVPPVFSPDGIGQALDCLRRSRFFVFKVHGDINIPGSIVLSNRDYARMLYLSPGYRSFLESVFSHFTVLFVGFGGSDPDMEAVVDRLSAIYERSISQHFMLVSEDQFSALERRRLLEDKRLDCIPYQRDASHSQVVEFLRALSHRVSTDTQDSGAFAGAKAKRRVFISGAYKQIDLLREIAEIARRSGYEPWFAESQVSPGDHIVDAIAKAIDESDCFVVVLTKDASASSWVHFEIGRAFGASKRVFPIRVGEADVPADIASVLYLQVQGPQLTPNDRARIANGLKRILEE